MIDFKDLGVIITAGGLRVLKGHEKSKLLVNICGKPVLQHVIDAVESLPAPVAGISTVISDVHEVALREFFSGYPKIKIAVQKNPMGTAHALIQMIKQGVFPRSKHVLILMGDMPLIRPQGIQKFYEYFLKYPGADAAILTFMADRSLLFYRKCSEVGYDSSGRFSDLVTGLPSTPGQKVEVHGGPYIFRTQFLLDSLNDIALTYANSSREYHLNLVLKRADHVIVYRDPDDQSYLGVDTHDAILVVERILKNRRKEKRISCS